MTFPRNIRKEDSQKCLTDGNDDSLEPENKKNKTRHQYI